MQHLVNYDIPFYIYKYHFTRYTQGCIQYNLMCYRECDRLCISQTTSIYPGTRCPSIRLVKSGGHQKLSRYIKTSCCAQSKNAGIYSCKKRQSPREKRTTRQELRISSAPAQANRRCGSRR